MEAIEIDSLEELKENINILIKNNTEDDFLTIAVKELACPSFYDLRDTLCYMNGCWNCWKRAVMSTGIKFKRECEGNNESTTNN